MGVDEVVALAFGGHVLEELLAELVEMLVDGHLRPVPDRSGLDVDDACVRAELLDARVVPLAPACEDVDLDAARAEIARELADVHVHAARVAAAELRERARVDGEHRDSRHGRVASRRTSQ